MVKNQNQNQSGSLFSTLHETLLNLSQAKLIPGIIIPLIIACALATIVNFQSRAIALSHADNQGTFTTYVKPIGVPQRKEWQTRAFANYTASWFLADCVNDEGQFKRDSFRNGVGRWSAFWFLMTQILFILAYREKSLFFMFGISAAITFGYTPGVVDVPRIYPWDLPPIFFFSAVILLIEKRKERFLLLLLPIATGFKETAMVAGLSFLFLKHLTWKKRIVWTAMTLAACLGVKTLIDLLTNNSAVLATMTLKSRQGALLPQNLRYFLNPRLNHPIFVNAGTLLGLLLLSRKGQHIVMLKCLCGAFIISLFLFGEIYEYRIWFEMTPLALMGLYKTCYSQRDSNSS